jgi:hypothetical protein
MLADTAHTMDAMQPPPPGETDRPDLRVPPRPDVGWHLLPPTVRPPRRRRGGVFAFLAILAAIAVISSVNGLGGVIEQTSRPKGSSDEYRFLAFANGRPVRWNPCQPIHYVVNVSEAPDGSLEDVQEAVSRVSADTGIRFVFDGPTQEIPQQDRQPSLPQLYGDRWAPVVISWAYENQTTIPFHQGENHYAAVARPLAPSDGTAQFVSGWVVINAADSNPPGWGSPADQGPTVLHELGHIMGLDHVNSNAELMEPSGGYMTDFGPGDLAGLERLGADQGCLTTPTVP